ncbi:MAG TPA: FtsK/SpoIIIE domain-containing protein, partial [Pirellulaceae bacterium]|nr:FtsK/SpoIIIE domain-containing protein [Pirellulaceae bacterium]
MTPEITTQRQRELIGRLTRLVARRAKDEVEIRRLYAERDARLEREYSRDRQQRATDFERQHETLVREFQDTREAVYRQYESAGCELAEEEHQKLEALSERNSESLEDAKHLWQHRKDDVESTYTMRQGQPQRDFNQFQQQCEYRETELQGLIDQAQKIVRRRCGWPSEEAPPPLPPAGLTKAQHVERINAAIARAKAKIHELQHAPAAAFLDSGWPALIFFLSACVTGPVAWFFLSHVEWYWIVSAAAALSLLLSLGSYYVALPLARRQMLRILPEFQLAVEQARGDLAAVLAIAKAESEKKSRKLLRRREKGLKAAQAEWEQVGQQQNEQHQAEVRKVSGEIEARRQRVTQPFERQLDEIAVKYPPLITRLERDFEDQAAALHQRYGEARTASREQYQREWTDLVTSWTAGLAEFQEVIGAMNDYCDSRFPDWDEIAGDSSQLGTRSANSSPRNGDSAVSVPALRFGRFDLELGSLEGGLPQDAELELPPARFQLPAVLSYPECPSLLIEAEGDGRDAATRLIQNVMLRLLTTFPPGKVRFTIIDPVGLGQNFSAFMHLADYDQRLVTSRIWTETPHINQRLADLTEHMENVIQKYLRNEFASIQEYNQQAGEVAEPFQILVVANFPANFSDESARRLVSIASSGARCGVY